ncbi:hypothetical protein EV180_007649, partial [Coemansia sp. RSA 518]
KILPWILCRECPTLCISLCVHLRLARTRLSNLLKNILSVCGRNTRSPHSPTLQTSCCLLPLVGQNHSTIWQPIFLCTTCQNYGISSWTMPS